LWCHP
jgi:hypothetical protein